MSADLLQNVVTAVLSSGVVAGLFALLTKKSQSPESQNELARLGNEFAAKLLEDARTERAELRLTIKDLEGSIDTKQESIDRLKSLLDEKDKKIHVLEELQHKVATKLQQGHPLTLADIFGGDAPDIMIGHHEHVV